MMQQSSVTIYTSDGLRLFNDSEEAIQISLPSLAKVAAAQGSQCRHLPPGNGASAGLCFGVCEAASASPGCADPGKQ
jgi:hypothetical protein